MRGAIPPFSCTSVSDFVSGHRTDLYSDNSIHWYARVAGSNPCQFKGNIILCSIRNKARRKGRRTFLKTALEAAVGQRCLTLWEENRCSNPVPSQPELVPMPTALSVF